jgi:hypothetical protein
VLGSTYSRQSTPFQGTSTKQGKGELSFHPGKFAATLGVLWFHTLKMACNVSTVQYSHEEQVTSNTFSKFSNKFTHKVNQ